MARFKVEINDKENSNHIVTVSKFEMHTFYECVSTKANKEESFQSEPWFHIGKTKYV